MEVEDMFGSAPEEEVVEEEVPTTQAEEAHIFSNVSTSSAPEVAVAISSPMSTNSSSSASYSNIAATSSYEEDTKAYQDWKAKHNADLEKKQNAEFKLKEQARSKGRDELAQLLADHKAKVEKTKSVNRQHESEAIQERDAQLSGKNQWESVNKYISSVSGKENHGTKDTSRMREVLLKMKHT